MKNNPVHRYFTLLEMVVSVAIFAIVILVASTGLVAVRQSWQRVYERNRTLENMLKIDRVVDTCFRNIIPFHWTDDMTKEEKSIFIGEPERVTFATMHRITAADFSAIRFVTFLLEDGKLIAEYRRSPIVSWNSNDQGLRREVLADKIESISFLYADADENGTIVWNSSWREDKPLNYAPLAIQITVTWDDGEKEQWLRRTAGAGRFESLGKRRKPSQQESDGAKPPENNPNPSPAN